MSGFSNAVVGGVGKLIRKWIQSPDYVPETSGWTVNQDGTVEFNDGTFRGTVEASNIILIGSSGEVLVYSGTPAAGNLILAISGDTGADAYGNTYTKGISLATTVATDPNRSSLQFTNPGFTAKPAMLKNVGSIGSPFLQLLGAVPDGNGRPSAEIDLIWQSGGGGHSEIDIRADSIQISPPIGAPAANAEVNIGTPLAIGRGLLGGYYYEEVALSQAQNYLNSTYTKPVNMTSQSLYSDYGSKWNLATGVWTCPVSGIYTFTINVLFTYAVANTRFIVIGQHNGVSTNVSDLISQNGNYTLTYNRYVDAGETFNALINQGSGATRQLQPYGYIGIRRAL